MKLFHMRLLIRYRGEKEYDTNIFLARFCVRRRSCMDNNKCCKTYSRINGKRGIKMEKISAVYKIVNTVTGDFYIGSSKNVKQRWVNHKCPSRWEQRPNSKMYQDMQKYGVEKFEFQILCSIMPECLKQVEQDCIQLMKPTYNNYNANGRNVERYKEAIKKHDNKPCIYKGETLTINALKQRFHKAGVEHYWLEAKKYLIKEGD